MPTSRPVAVNTCHWPATRAPSGAQGVSSKTAPASKEAEATQCAGHENPAATSDDVHKRPSRKRGPDELAIDGADASDQGRPRKEAMRMETSGPSVLAEGESVPTKKRGLDALDHESGQAKEPGRFRQKAKTVDGSRSSTSTDVEPQVSEKRTADEPDGGGAKALSGNGPSEETKGKNQDEPLISAPTEPQHSNKESQQSNKHAADEPDFGGVEAGDVNRQSETARRPKGGDVGLSTSSTEQARTARSHANRSVLPDGRRFNGTRPSWGMEESDISGRFTFGAEDPRADLKQHPVKGLDSEQIWDELWPPGQADQGPVNNRRYERTRVQMITKSAMKALASDCRNLVMEWTYAMKLDPNFDTIFVTTPSTALHALYQKFFGAEDWQQALLKRQNRPTPWIYVDFQVLQGLIAAFIHTEVFTKAVPWDIPQRINAASGVDLKYGVESMLDKGYHLDEFLKKWSFKMIQDEQFQHDVVRPHAHNLATRLALTLTPHLVESRKCQKQLDKDDIGNTVTDNTDWVGDLEKLIFDALIYKEKIGTYHEVSYEYTWGVPGSVLDSTREDPAHRNVRFKNEVHFTLWPGLRMIPDGRYCGGDPAQTVYTFVEARQWPKDRPLPSEDQLVQSA